MASAWGSSWSTAWANSWGTAGVTPPPTPPAVDPGVGNLDWLKRRKKKPVRIKLSDYARQEEYAAALAAAAIPLTQITETGEVEGESEIDDDDAILRALFLLKTIQ